jgi:CRP-like cAMP-binding protein
LRRVPLFARLQSADLTQLAGALRSRTYAKGETIVRRDDAGTSLLIIAQGSVRISLSTPDGREVTLTLLGQGDSFGELALFDGEPRSADAIALERTRLLVLQRDAFLSFLAERPEAGLVLLAALARLIRRLTDQVYDSVFLDLSTRLARALLKLCTSEQGEARPATIRMTQTQIGALVGATRESVNKWLGFYERRGIIQRERGALVILKPRDLERFASVEEDGW